MRVVIERALPTTMPIHTVFPGFINFLKIIDRLVSSGLDSEDAIGTFAVNIAVEGENGEVQNLRRGPLELKVKGENMAMM